jgi:beta-D-xylosidase 4
MHPQVVLSTALFCLLVSSAAQSIPQNNATLMTRACRPGFDSYPFCNTSLSISQRVADLIARLELSDIPPLLTARHGENDGPLNNISRIGVPEYDWGVNCLHGVQTSCTSLPDGSTRCPTSFPNPVNFGFTWNRSLAYGLGAVIATELRALWLAGAVEASGVRPHAGLDCWSPNSKIVWRLARAL